MKALFLLFLAYSLSFTEEAKKPMFSPFGISIGEQKASVKTHMDLLATFPKPVAKDAILTIEGKSDAFIVNAFNSRKSSQID